MTIATSPRTRLSALAAGALLALAAHAQGLSPRPIDLPAAPLEQSLNTLARKTGVQIVFASPLAAGRTAPAVRGTLTPHQALEQVLAGSGLAVRVADGGQTYVIERAAGASQAAPGGAEGSLAEVKVTATSEVSASSEGTGTYAARATTIGKTVQTLREIPQSVSVITRQRMDDQNMTTLSDVMRQATGVTMNGNGNGASSFYARQNTLEAQYDGVPGFSSLSQSQFDMALYDRVEILRGPAGLLQGSGNPSGVVNLVRKRPQVQFEGAGSVSIGSWNQRRVELDAGGPVNEGGSVRLRGVLTGEDRDFFYDHAGRRNWTAYGAAEVDLTPRTTVGISLALQKTTLIPFSGLPAYDDGSFLGLPRSTNLDAGWSRYARDLQEGVVDFSHRFDDRWTLKASLRHRRNETDQLWGNPRGTVSRATGLGGVEVVNGNYIYENTGADVHLSGSFDAFGRRHEVLVGYSHDAYQSTSAGSYYEATGVDLRDPSIYDMSLLPPIASTTANKTTQSGLYAMGRLKLADPLTLIVGGRLTDYQNEARNVAPVATAWDGQGRARARNEFTPHLGVVYDVSPTLTAYGSYSDIFIPQTAIDYHGKVLEPRVGWQTEVGLKGEFFDKRLQASMAAFRIRDRNRAMTDPDPTHVGPPCGTSATSSCSIAAGLVQIQGWEIELIGRVSTKVDIALGYSRVTGKNT